MNIFKSFEIFLREPLSLLKKGLIQIANVQSGIEGDITGVNVDMLGQKTQITVVNSQKMYNLLSATIQRQKQKELRQLLPQQPKQIVLGQLMKRI